MTEAIIKGVILGLGLALMIGPVFFMMLETSIQKGVRAASFVALGVACSDTMYIAMNYNLIKYLSSNVGSDTRGFNIALGVLGGVLMFVFGVGSLLKKPSRAAADADQSISKKEIFRYFLRGFLLNTINPFVFIFWIAPVSAALRAQEGFPRDMMFFASIIATVLSTDLLKVYLAQRLNRFLSDTVLLWFNRISGMVLIGFGIRLLYFAFTEWRQ